MVRTDGSHPSNRGSIPRGATTKSPRACLGVFSWLNPYWREALGSTVPRRDRAKRDILLGFPVGLPTKVPDLQVGTFYFLVALWDKQYLRVLVLFLVVSYFRLHVWQSCVRMNN